MTQFVALSSEEVARLLDPERLMTALEEAFKELSAGQVSVPPRVGAYADNGALFAMPGRVKDALAAKLVTWYGNNPSRGLPAAQAVIAVFDASVGTPIGILDGNSITAARTAASTAISVRHLARENAAVLAIVGAGVQGSAHLAYVPLTRQFRRVIVTSRSFERTKALAAEYRVEASSSIEGAVRVADVVCLCTHSAEPVVKHAWLKQGCHITSVGSVQTGSELALETVRAASLFVESRSAFAPYPVGAWELHDLDPKHATELGELLSGTRLGRTDPTQLTLYKSTGHAVEDVAAARLVLELAKAEGLGQRIEI